MCYKCGADLQCGESCCRSKSKGPYRHRETINGITYEICEMCGFAIDADVNVEMNYSSCILDGSWFQETCYDADIIQHMKERAAKEYDKYFQEYVIKNPVYPHGQKARNPGSPVRV